MVVVVVVLVPAAACVMTGIAWGILEARLDRLCFACWNCLNFDSVGGLSSWASSDMVGF